MLRKSVWVLSFLVVVFGNFSPAYGNGINATMRAEDRRLDKPVTIIEQRIYLSELLDQLSQQTGIPIHIDEHEASSGIQVEVVCKATPVVDVMTALWSLVSARDADWVWIRGGKSGAFTYLLFEPPLAQDKAARRRAFAQQSLENYVRVVSDMALMSPEERERHKSDFQNALLGDDTFADALIKLQDYWNVVRLFTQAVPPDMQLRVLRGEERTEIPVKSLSPDLQQLLYSLRTMLHVPADENGISPNYALRYYTKSDVFGSEEVVPSVFIDMGQAGSYSFLGGYSLGCGIRNVIRKMWMMPGDSQDSPAAQNKVEKPKAEDAPTPPNRSDSRNFQLRLQQIAQGAALPVIALLPLGIDDPGSPYDHTVQEFLEKFRTNLSYPMYKWRGNFLLINYTRWFQDDDTSIPYFIIRYSRHGSDEPIPLADLVKFVVGVEGRDSREVSELAASHPALNIALQFAPVFRLYKQNPSLLSQRGMPLDADTLSKLRQIPLLAGRIPENATNLRLRQEDEVKEDTRTLRVRIEIQAGNSAWKSVRSFVQSVPRQPITPQK